MKRSSSAAAAAVSVSRAHPRPPRPELTAPDALLRFQLRTYQPRAASASAAAASPFLEADRPGSIKEAIIRWLDEQI